MFVLPHQTLLNSSRWLAIATAVVAPISTAMTNITCVFMVLALLCSGHLWNALKQAAAQPAGKMLLAFFVWLVIGMFYADTEWHERIDVLLSWKKLAYLFLLLGLFGDGVWQPRFVRVFVSAMSVAAVAAITLWLCKWDVKPEWGLGIFMTTYVSQSMAFIAASVCGVVLLKSIQDKRLIALLCIALLLFAVNIYFISKARSGYVAYPFAMLLAVVFTYSWKRILQISLVMCLLLGLAVSTSSMLQQRIALGLAEKNAQPVATGEVTSIGIRRIFAENTWELIQQNPVFGYGTSSFRYTYEPYVVKKYNDWRNTATGDPHNQYLFIWLENGAIGLLIFLLCLAVMFRQALTNRPYGVMAAGFLLAICVSSLFNSHFKTFPEGHLFAFFVGILLARHAPTVKMQH